MAAGEPKHVIAAGRRDLLRGFQFNSGARILDISPTDLIRQANLVVPRWIKLIECAVDAAGSIAVARGVIEFGKKAREGGNFWQRVTDDAVPGKGANVIR